MNDEQARSEAILDLQLVHTALRPEPIARLSSNIENYWFAHFDKLGSVVGPERKVTLPASSNPDKAIYQAFLGGVVKYTPGSGTAAVFFGS